MSPQVSRSKTQPAKVDSYVPPHGRMTMLAAVVLPLAGLATGFALCWERGFSWLELGLCVGMYLSTGFGVTVGYHRLFTHRSFETVWPVKLALGVLGSMAAQGPLLKWAAMHRMHHHRSDTRNDPHSPFEYGTGFLQMLRGFWHAHVGWMFRADPPGLVRYIGDLLSDPLLCVVSKWFPLWVLLGLLIPSAIGGLVTGNWYGCLMGFLWGGLARLFFVHHLTFSINSVCHLWGRRPFDTRDQSRNNFIFGVLGMGEGWHNNHHAFPTSARHGLMWWQIDLSYLLIRGLALLKLARKVHLPESNEIARRLTVLSG